MSPLKKYASSKFQLSTLKPRITLKWWVSMKSHLLHHYLGTFSDDDLAYAGNGCYELPVEAIPCHSINNECLVQASAQAVKYSVGGDCVHERLLNNQASQLKIPTNFNKSHFSGVPKK